MPEPAASPRYPTAIDAWLVVAILLAIGGTLAEAVYLFPHSPSGAFVAISIAVLVAGAVGTLSFPCEYVLEADHLLVRSGLVRWRVPYRTITAIAPSRSPWSSPALSLRRVRIDHARGVLLVSPRDRAGFMAALATRVAAARGDPPAG
jgi:hypothetical protein